MDAQQSPDPPDDPAIVKTEHPVPEKPRRLSRKIIVSIIIAILLVAAGVVAYAQLKHKNGSDTPSKTAMLLPTNDAAGRTVSYGHAEAMTLSNGDCKGAGAVNIIPPMELDQVSSIQPYGGVVGGHVTPIDHQYYNGLNPKALRDTYDVVAPADGTIVGITHRGTKTNTPLHSVDVPSSDEYRIVMSHTCSFYTYVDLVTSLDPNVLSKLPKNWTPNGKNVTVSVPIKQGEVIGHIGGQTLDFAVWDLSKRLPGFVNPSDYAAENWKPYTAPPSNYFEKSIKAAAIAKYLRTTPPIDGKIDYDIDGKLVGNWFLQGSGGYHASSNTAVNYWAGHLSIAPDSLDPAVYIASIGDFSAYTTKSTYQQDTDSSGAGQFVIQSAAPDPTTVGTASGLVKYELIQRSYTLPSGGSWLGGFATGITIPTGGNPQVVGTILAQLTATRTLKFEVFPGKTPAQVAGFDTGVKTYTR